MSYDRTDRFRRAAILVASLDEALAEQLLAELPAAEAARVLAEAERLESIDPDEQRDVLAEFRRLSRSRGRAEVGVEFSPSAPPDSDSVPRSDEPSTALASATEVSSVVNEADAAAMAELLAAEHPQIVAAALTRMGEAQSAAVFAALPPEVQAEALERLTSLAPADEGALMEVESQLHSQLRRQRDHRARAVAGAELVRKILARTPAAQRTYLLQRMSAKAAAESPSQAAPSPHSNSSPAATPDRRTPAVDHVAQQALSLASAVRRAQAEGRYEAAPLEDRTPELEALDAESLVAALRAADQNTVLRALAASGDAFLERVTRMLPRRQAKKLRKMLRAIGPTRLAELHQAQHDLLRLAHAVVQSPAAAA